MPSAGNAPRWGRTNGSAFFVSSARCRIHIALHRIRRQHSLLHPEYKVQLEKLIDLLITDKKNNPAIIV